MQERAANAVPLDGAASVCVLIHDDVASQASTPLKAVLFHPPIAVMIAGPANTRVGLELQDAVPARLVSSHERAGLQQRAASAAPERLIQLPPHVLASSICT